MACAALALSGCHPEQPTRYTVHGVVREVDAGQNVVIIANEAVPGYMDAMTMPFKVKDPAILDGLKPNQPVIFSLVASPTDAYIEKIEPASIKPNGTY
jgi:protein SCO1/2